MPLIIALVVAGVLVLGGITAGGVAMVRAGGDDPSPTPTATKSSPSPTTSSPTPTPSATTSSPSPTSTVPLTERLNKRSSDPKPLTLGELFPRTYKSEEGRRYVRKKTKMHSNCQTSVRGAKLERALKSGKCSQVALGTYVDSKNKTVTTIGLANMVDIKSSERVASAVKPTANRLFVPLNGKGATFSGKNFAEFATAIGHFVVISAVTYTNRSPSSVSAKMFNARGDMSDMINRPLSLRMILARP